MSDRIAVMHGGRSSDAPAAPGDAGVHPGAGPGHNPAAERGGGVAMGRKIAASCSVAAAFAFLLRPPRGSSAASGQR